MRLISKYVLKEHLGPLVFALSALTSLLLLNYIAKQFDKLVGKGLGWGVIGEFFLLSIPFTVAMTLPMAVLVSTLYAFSRLAAENEVTALKASGVSLARVMIPVLIGATFLAGLMVWFNDRVLPAANHRLSVLQQDIARKKPTFALRERVMNELSPGRLFLRTNHLDPATNRMREIEIVDLSNPTVKRTIHADSGVMEFTEGQVDLFLILHDGYLQEIPSKDPGQFQRHFFERNRIRVRGVGNQLVRTEGGGFKGDREMTICEMQREVDQAYTELESQRETLEGLLAGQARAAVHGVEEDLEPVIPTETRKRGLGLAYCRALAALTPDRPLEPERPIPQQLPGNGASMAPRGDSVFAMGDAAVSTQVPLLASAREAVIAAAPPQAPSARAQAEQLRSPRTHSPRRPAVLDPATGRTLVPEPLERQAQDSAAAGMAQAVAGRPDMPVRVPGIENVDRRLRPTGQIAAQMESLRSQMEIARQTMQRYDVEIQKKFALAVACVVFVLLGAPVALRFPRGGVGMTLGVSLIVFAIYYVGLIGGEALADRGLLTPFWAMWAANVIFAAVGLVLLARMGREGATSRGGDFGEMREQARMWLAKQGRRVGLPLERRRRPA